MTHFFHNVNTKKSFFSSLLLIFIPSRIKESSCFAFFHNLSPNMICILKENKKICKNKSSLVKQAQKVHSIDDDDDDDISFIRTICKIISILNK